MKRILSLRSVWLAVVLGTLFAVVPVPALSLSAPRTLSAERAIGTIHGTAPTAEPSFHIDYLGLSWTSGDEPEARFRAGGSWGPWTHVHEDEIPRVDGRTWSALVPAGGADAYQVRGNNDGVRAVALNTTDGPRSLVWETPRANASHLVQPPLISRAGWGADESLRCNANGTPKHSWTFHPTGKLIVHHTVTANEDPDPAATVRAIYHYHVVNRGFIDIAYNFLVDAQGHIYKGRYSGPNGTCLQDTPTGEDAQRRGVTGAHTGGWNSGTMGIAILGNYVSTPIPDAARQSLVQHLAWEAERHGLDPLATTAFSSPAGGSTKTAPNISGHRDWTTTQCPGETLYDALPGIRQEVAALVGSVGDRKPPRITRIRETDVGRRWAEIKWRTSEPATEQVQYWAPGRKRRTSPLDGTLARGHAARLRGLKRGTAYAYRVIGWDAAGNRAISRKQGFTTAG